MFEHLMHPRNRALRCIGERGPVAGHDDEMLDLDAEFPIVLLRSRFEICDER